MKIYMWANGRSETPITDDEVNNFAVPGSSNAHTGGAIVIAADVDAAKHMLIRWMEKSTLNYYWDDFDIDMIGDPVIIDLNKAGVLFYADGDC